MIHEMFLDIDVGQKSQQNWVQHDADYEIHTTPKLQH